jgi:hypothetical protein
MKQLSLFLLALSLLFTACNTKCVEDSGIRVERAEQMEAFEKLEIRGPIKVILQQDTSYKVRIAADSNIIEDVKVSVGSKTLKLKLDPEKYCGQDSVIVYAGVLYLTSIRMENNSKLASDALLNFKNVELNLDGNTEVDMELTAGKMTTTVDGTSKITLRGQAGEHNLKSTGALILDAFDFVTAKISLNTEGVNKANINVLNDLNLETTGTSEVYYKGSPKNINKKKAGTAILEKVN